MRVLNLDILEKGLPGVSPTVGAFYREAAIVGLMKSGHISGVILETFGEIEDKLKVVWDEKFDIQLLNNWNEERVFVEAGAVAISICIFIELFGYHYFEEAKHGTGIDYWIGKANLNDDFKPLKLREGRLEISGIMKERTGNTIQIRTKIKKNQMALSDVDELPGWIAVVEFFTPKSKISKK